LLLVVASAAVKESSDYAVFVACCIATTVMFPVLAVVPLQV
jgi:hypothetical protein